MSHFSTVKTTLSHRQSLLKALEVILEKVGINSEIENHNVPVLLNNDYDKTDEQQAEVVIRRNFLEGLLDLGFRWHPEQNSFESVIDPWDFERNLLGKHFKTVQNFLEELQIAHNTAFIDIHYPEHLWTRETLITGDGTTTITLTQKVDVYA
ncbi:DUF1257 domain-containing protein [Planktothrix sp. FACHB-1365]|uniref:DUF1257 domain-containing protein n=1 Tax=Planktothrix sp. FACHB-1365 TaxID=2692855 RepID=UPI0016856EAC|nr:DUF1257 domain-containing protein [Planktothrix sp. FACHB-1365]MBD2485620.1 DUF1257 domain-containing protein [Planktothrix sp. FACHB-1365]